MQISTINFRKIAIFSLILVLFWIPISNTQVKAESDSSGDLPSPPQNLLATPGDGYITLTWDPPLNEENSNIIKYYIYRETGLDKLTPGSTKIKIAEATTTNYTDKEVTNCREYYYQVSGVNSLGEGEKSNEASATPFQKYPTKIPWVWITSKDGQIFLSWEKPCDYCGPPIIKYNIYRATTSDSTKTMIGETTSTSFVDTNVTNGEKYYYQISAVNQFGEGEKSDEVTHLAGPAPGEIDDLIAVPKNNEIFLSWSPPEDNGFPITKYYIYRETLLEKLTPCTTKVKIAEATNTSYTDTQLKNGEIYFYQVTAVNPFGEGEKSNEVSATPGILLQKEWIFQKHFQYNLDNNYETIEGTGSLKGKIILSGGNLSAEGEIILNGPLPVNIPEVYLITTNGPNKELTKQLIEIRNFHYSQQNSSTFSFSGQIINVVQPINNGHFEISAQVNYDAIKYEFFLNTNSQINNHYFPLTENQPPTPIISFHPKNPVKGTKVKFDGAKSFDFDGEIVSFEWQIASSTFYGTTTEFTFDENGEYQINLIVADEDGATSSTSTIIKVEPFSFAIITDLHIGRHYQEEYEGEDYYLTQRLRNVVNWINQNKDNIKCEENATCSLKFVAVLGDIVENTPLAGFCKVKEILDQLQIPYVPVFGNHDVGTDEEFEKEKRWAGQDYFDQVFWSTSSIPCQNTTSTKNFELLLNDLNFQRDETNKDYKNFSFSFGGINFIGLDFVSREPFMKFGKGVGADAVLNEINKGWLEKKLEEFKGEPVILFTHHPLIFDPINAFSFTEFSQLENLLKDNITVFFDFAGHIHSFEEWHGKGWWVANANKKYTPIAFTNVLTTEALMVGSNGRGVEEETEENGVVNGKKGIIRIVKVSEKNEIKPNNWETAETGDEFLAFNPSIGFGFSRQMTACVGCTIKEIPCVELKADAFCDKTKKLFIPIWSFDDGSSTTTEALTKCDFALGVHTITLTLKDPHSDFSESISKKIEINENIIARTINRTIDQIQKGIEFVSEKAKQSFDKIRQIGKDTIYIIKHSEPTPIGTINIDFDKTSKDIEFSNLVADTDPTHSKTILYLPEWPVEVERSKVLFLPKNDK